MSAPFTFALIAFWMAHEQNSTERLANQAAAPPFEFHQFDIEPMLLNMPPSKATNKGM